jgi:predicted aldo/keto reductase-like oxidoreductase
MEKTKDSKDKKSIGFWSRRNFLKGIGAAAAGGVIYQGLKTLKLLPQGRELADPPKDQMAYRTNPKTLDKVSLLGFGCMRLPMIPGAQSPNGSEIDVPTAVSLIDYAYDHGVNYFDTAWPYHRGNSEVVMGEALKKYPRSSFYVADKMPTFAKPDLDKAKEIFRTQLERCQLEYFDYYMLHNIMTVEDYKLVYEENKVMDFLLEQRKEGRIRNLGFSFHGDKETLDYLVETDVDWDVAMVQLNYHDLMHAYEIPKWRRSDRLPAEPRYILERVTARKLPMVIMEPLLGGRLSRLSRKAVNILQGEKPQSSPASWAFRYIGSNPDVLTVLSGMTILDHVKDNLRTHAPFETLSEREMGVLKQALDVFITQENIPCTACGYCLPCPYDVNIPAVFTHYNICVDDEYVPKGSRTEEYEKARRAYLVSYDRTVPELRQASHCTGCGVCLEHCPQGIAISEQMARLSKFAEDLRSQV